MAMQWTQGTSTCNASYAGGASGSSTLLRDTVAPTTGTATAICANGVVALTAPLCVTAAPPPPPPPPNPVTHANIVASCTGCHGLTSNGVVFASGGYTVTNRTAQNWLSTVNNMVGRGSTLAPGTTAQNYADFLANPN
jgi:hypothetical protein